MADMAPDSLPTNGSPFTQVMFTSPPKYWGNGLYGTTAWFSRCESCGAFVGDSLPHNAMHATVTELQNTVASLQSTVAELQTEVAALQTPPTTP